MRLFIFILVLFCCEASSWYRDLFYRHRQKATQYSQNDEFKADCPKKKLIVIQSAKYENAGMCGDSNAKGRMELHCNGRSTCSLLVSDAFFTGSNCPTDVAEKLVVDYDCEKGERLKQGKSMTLQANAGETIRIIIGHYVAEDKKESCGDPGAFETLKAACNFKTTCTVEASDSYFSDSTCPENVDETLILEYQSVKDPCSDYYCAHQGTCSGDLFFNPVCDCADEWKGKRCDGDPCAGISCTGNGECLARSDGTYQCVCSEGFEGYDCSTQVDPCDDHFCTPNGVCVNNGGEATCQCHPGYSGEVCEIPDNPCDTHPCQETGKCVVNLEGNAECLCDIGYIGTNCGTKASLCELDICSNNGLCVYAGEGLPKCDCSNTGYFGDTCNEQCPSSDSVPVISECKIADPATGNCYIIPVPTAEAVFSWGEAVLECAKLQNEHRSVLGSNAVIRLWEPNNDDEVNLVFQKIQEIHSVPTKVKRIKEYWIGATDYFLEGTPFFSLGSEKQFPTSLADYGWLAASNLDGADCVKVVETENDGWKFEYGECPGKVDQRTLFICEVQNPCS